MTEFPSNAVAAIERGEVIQAIKLVRQHTGWGLKESKEAVERYIGGDHSPLASPGLHPSADSSALPAAAVAALALGNKLEAVKLVRSATGMGLAESKDLVEAYAIGNSAAPYPGRGQASVPDAQAEPGRVASHRYASPLLWLAVAAVGAGAWLYFNNFL